MYCTKRVRGSQYILIHVNPTGGCDLMPPSELTDTLRAEASETKMRRSGKPVRQVLRHRPLVPYEMRNVASLKQFISFACCLTIGCWGFASLWLILVLMLCRRFHSSISTCEEQRRRVALLSLQGGSFSLAGRLYVSIPSIDHYGNALMTCVRARRSPPLRSGADGPPRVGPRREDPAPFVAAASFRTRPCFRRVQSSPQRRASRLR
jgi:hypothetical protein